MTPLMSIEVELFLWADRMCPRETLHAVYAHLKRSLPHVTGVAGMAGSEPGIFLPGGERIYPDTSNRCAHLEIAYPLFANASQLLAAYNAGFDRIFQAAQHVGVVRNAKTRLFACNHCYEPLNVTFGLHENYTYRGDFKAFVHNMAPLQVALSQPCGAGGFDNRRLSIQFIDAPRKLHINRLQGSQTSPGRRALVDSYKSNPYGRCQRRQLLTADQVHPGFAHQLWLRMAVTRAFVWLSEQNIRLDDSCRPADLLAALHSANDQCWNPPIKITTGDEISLWEFQRRICDFLKDRLELLPSEIRDETERACQLWDRTIDAMECDLDEASRLLSWCGQLRMLKQYTACKGYDWQEIQKFDQVLLELQTAENSPKKQSAAAVLRPCTNHANFDKACGKLDIDAARARDVFELLPQLQYLSIKWSEIGQNIFSDHVSSDATDIEMSSRDVRLSDDRYGGTVTREMQRCELLEQHADSPGARAGWDRFVVNGATYRWDDPWSVANRVSDETETPVQTLSLVNDNERKTAMEIRDTQVWIDLHYVFDKFPVESLRHVIRERHRLIRGMYQDRDGNGCLFNLLSEPLSPDRRIDSKVALTRYFTGSSGPVAAELPQYQPARWLVRLIDGMICCGVKSRYPDITELPWSDVIACMAEHLAARQSRESEHHEVVDGRQARKNDLARDRDKSSGSRLLTEVLQNPS